MVKASDISLSGYTISQRVSLRKFREIDNYALADGEYYYFVKNVFNDEMYSQSATLYAFRIVKTTRCYHFLSNGHRLRIDSEHRALKRTPKKAMRAAISRAHLYLNILRSKAEGVYAYLQLIEEDSRYEVTSLRQFEKFLLKLDNVEDVPDHMLLDSKNPFEQEPAY